MNRPWIFALLLAVAAPPLGAEVVRLDAASQARAGIAVEPIGEHSFGDRMRVVGQVVRAPGATSTVKSILEGRVEALYVAPGEAVRRGQPLVLLHSHALHRLQGELLRSHEELRLAENRVEAGRQLLAVEGISRLELERREQEALKARLALQAVTAELEDLGYDEAEIAKLIAASKPHPTLTLRAPADGVVLEVTVQQHSWVEAYERLLVVGDPHRLELELQLPAEQAARVAPGDRVEFVPVGRPGLAARAQVVSQVPEVDPSTRTVTIRAALEVVGEERLLPGVFVEGTLTHGSATISVALPESAVFRLGTDDYVFVRRGREEFDARRVELGRFDGTRYEVLGGVVAGDEVAVAGVFLLKSALVRGPSGED